MFTGRVMAHADRRYESYTALIQTLICLSCLCEPVYVRAEADRYNNDKKPAVMEIEHS